MEFDRNKYNLEESLVIKFKISKNQINLVVDYAGDVVNAIRTNEKIIKSYDRLLLKLNFANVGNIERVSFKIPFLTKNEVDYSLKDDKISVVVHDLDIAEFDSAMRVKLDFGTYGRVFFSCDKVFLDRKFGTFKNDSLYIDIYSGEEFDFYSPF